MKQSVLVDGAGGPLAISVAGANRNDHLLLKATLEAIVVDRPLPSQDHPQHLCLDKGYANQTGRRVTEEFGYVPHIRRIGEEKRDDYGKKTQPARRWVVERTFAWLSKCRALLVRYDKKAKNYLGLLCLASALLWFRRLTPLCLSR